MKLAPRPISFLRRTGCALAGLALATTLHAQNFFIPEIQQQPQSETVPAGPGASLTVVMVPGSVGPQVSYQWYFNRVPFGPPQSGGRSSNAFGPFSPAAESGDYMVEVTDTGGTVDSSTAVVTVESSPTPTPTPTPSAAVGSFTQPRAQTVATGASAVFSVGPAQSGVLYQWDFNGTALSDSAPGTGPHDLVSGSHSARLLITDATAVAAGAFTCTLTGTGGAVTSNPAALQVVTTADPGRLTNLSCRAAVGTGTDVMIAGFVVGGPGTGGSEPVLVRASGPALAAFGLSGTLPDPELSLFAAGGALVAADTGWGGSAAITAAAAQVGAFAWTNTGSADSAVVASLPPGSFTAEVQGAAHDAGVALVEIYAATPAAAYTPTTPRLVNTSARLAVGSGGNTLIVGFVVGGATAETVLIRASGPALSAFGVTDFLDQPALTLFDSANAPVATNTGWQGDAQVAQAASLVGAFSWGGNPTPDSALLITLAPGAYTAQVVAADGSAGVTLIEVYEVE